MKQIVNMELLGSLFRYYRGKVSRRDYIEGKNITLISLRRIEEGSASFGMCVSFCKEVGISISNKKKDYEILNKYVSDTYNILNSGKTLSEYRILKEEIEAFFLMHKNEIYLSELCSLCINVLNIYLYSRVTNLDLIEICDNCFIQSDYQEVNMLSRFLLGRYAIYYLNISDIERRPKYLSYGTRLYGNRIFVLDEYFYDLARMNKNDLKNKYDYFDFNYEDNNVYKFNYYVVKACIELESENYKDGEDLLTLAIGLDNIEQVIPSNIFLEVYGLLTCVYIAQKNFEAAFSTCLKANQDSGNDMEIMYLLLFVLAEKINRIDIIKDVLLNRNIFNNPLKENIRSYFKEKYVDGNDLDILTACICDFFTIDKCDSLFMYCYFKKELFDIMKETKKYVYFFEFIGQSEFDGVFKSKYSTLDNMIYSVLLKV